VCAVAMLAGTGHVTGMADRPRSGPAVHLSAPAAPHVPDVVKSIQ